MIPALQPVLVAVGGSSPDAGGSWSVTLRIGLVLVLSVAAVVLAGEFLAARSHRTGDDAATPARSPDDDSSARRTA